MKIFICVHNLANGGAERVSSLWANGFSNDGHEVHLLICEKNAPVNYEIDKKIIIHNISADGNPISRYFKKVINLRGLLKSIKPDVAMGVLHPWNIWLLLANIGLKTILINTEHDCFERPQEAPLKKSIRIEKFFLNRFFKTVTVLNNRDKELLSKHMDNVRVMPNPLTFDPVDDAPRKEKIILAAGRLDDWYCKGFDVLIRAWAKISNDFLDWKLCIAGKGGQEDYNLLSAIIRECNIDNKVELLGFCENLKDWYNKSSVFVLSSRYEGFGMVLLEAMSQGCICIACDYHGRQGEIVTDEKNGFLCRGNDVDELSFKLKTVLSKIEKNDRIDIIRREAIQRSKDYTIDKIIGNWYSVFNSIKENY